MSNVVQCTFRSLKAHWRYLVTRLAMAEETITTVSTACAALHNICEDKGQVSPEDPAIGRPLIVSPNIDIHVINRPQKIVGTFVRATLVDSLWEGGCL